MLTIGFATPVDLWRSDLDTRRTTIAALAEAGVDQVFMADHVSFIDGHGTDGFVEIAALSQLHPNIEVMISVYLLALRHPLPVARQLATMSTIAPGRIRLGVGVGGEDRHEIEVCGVDPRTRGRRTDASLDIIRRLMAGEPVDHHDEFFDIEAARIRPRVDPAIPVIVGGRSDAAVRRAARIGDGWIGAWCSPRRFTEAVGMIDDLAGEAGRDVEWQHGYQPWVGVGPDHETATARVAEAMEAFYSVPFAAFDRYTPRGTPAEVADQLRPYVDAGCRIMNLKIVAGDDAESIEAAGEIASRLKA